MCRCKTDFQSHPSSSEYNILVPYLYLLVSAVVVETVTLGSEYRLGMLITLPYLTLPYLTVPYRTLPYLSVR